MFTKFSFNADHKYTTQKIMMYAKKLTKSNLDHIYKNYFNLTINKFTFSVT